MPSPSAPDTRSTRTVWIRCDDSTKTSVLLELEEFVQAEIPQVWFEVTLPSAELNFVAHPKTTKEINSFCNELAPDILLWVGGALDPLTLSVCQTKGIYVILADAGIAMLPKLRRGWFPGKTRSILAQLDFVFARTQEAANGLIRSGVPEHLIHVSGSLEEIGNALPCEEEDRFAMTQMLGHRPIWLAAQVDRDELPHIARAHKEASRSSHRLLCFLIPEGDPDDCAKILRENGLSVTLAARGDTPNDATQVHIVDGGDKAGLWYRLAPITYIGGSISGRARVDPFYLATVGSVVLHGRNFGQYAIHFDALMQSQATFVCDSFDILGRAVSHLLSADKAAKYAQRGWDVTSQGADVLNMLSMALIDRLEEGNRHDA